MQRRASSNSWGASADEGERRPSTLWHAREQQQQSSSAPSSSFSSSLFSFLSCSRSQLVLILTAVSTMSLATCIQQARASCRHAPSRGAQLCGPRALPSSSSITAHLNLLNTPESLSSREQAESDGKWMIRIRVFASAIGREGGKVVTAGAARPIGRLGRCLQPKPSPELPRCQWPWSYQLNLGC